MKRIVMFLIIVACFVYLHSQVNVLVSPELNDVIRNNIKDYIETNFEDNDKVILLLFLNINNSNYMIFNTASIYSEKLLKKFIIYEDDIILIYEGFEDDVANQYLNLDQFEDDRNLLNERTSLNIDNLNYSLIYDPKYAPKYYRIEDDGLFIEIELDEKFQKSLKNVLIENGYESSIPPPPVE